MKPVLLFALLLGAAVAEESLEDKTVENVAGFLKASQSIASNVATLLVEKVPKAIPGAGIFTSLFSFISTQIQNDDAFWKKAEMRIREIVKEEVGDYHQLLKNEYLAGIKRSLQIFNSLSAFERGQPSQVKIQQGAALSTIINTNRMWLNVEMRSHPYKVLGYFMEVASIDIAVLYNLAALYGSRERSHWKRFESSLGYHIEDADRGAKKTLEWRLSVIKCSDTECTTGYRRCGPKGASKCAVKQRCKKAADPLREVCRTERYPSRCGAKGCTRTKRVCENYSKTKVGASNCDFFKSDVTANTNAWLNPNVYKHLSNWRKLHSRARGYAG